MRTDRSARRQITGILLLDKPQGITSNAALQQVKQLYQAEKAGHTGSLDPLATGLLPVCLGHATKLSGYLLDSDKRYQVRAKLGQRTDTADADGTVIASSDFAAVSRTDLENALPRFIGDIRQTPPMYSALKHQGRRLYELARAGEEVVREERTVHIHALSLGNFGDGIFELDVRCSKGTYIRTLVEDVAGALAQHAHVVALRRLEIAPFYEPQMVTLERLAAIAASDLTAADALLLSPLAVLAGWPEVRVDGARAAYLAHGQAVRVANAPTRGRVAIVDSARELLGVGEIDADGMVAPKRWMA